MNTLEQISQERLVLSDNTIHVYLIKFDLFDNKQCIQYLSEDERIRAEKLKIEEKKNQFVITRSVLRLLLSSAIAKSYQDIEFLYGEHGKPIINEYLNNKPVEFNISHSGNYALIAITLSNKVGVDIEGVNIAIDHQSLSKRFFSKDEKNELINLVDEVQLDTFYRIWARKESFIKATGKGVAYGLDQFSVTLDETIDGGTEVLTFNPLDDKWFCYDLINIDNYKTALTTTNKTCDIVIHA